MTRRLTIRYWWWFCSLLLAASMDTAAGAEQVYIVDHTSVGIREGKSVSDPLLGVLTTGTKLEVLKREDAFVRARTAEGLEGWLGAEYVMPQPPARDRVEALEARLMEAQTRLTTATTKAQIPLRPDVDLAQTAPSLSLMALLLFTSIGAAAGFVLGRLWRGAHESPRLRGYRL